MIGALQKPLLNVCGSLLIAAFALTTRAALAQVTGVEASDAPATQPTRVVLIASPGMDQLVVRFAAELDSLHLEVVRAPDTEGGPTLLELEQLARDNAARVAVRVAKAGTAVDLWVASPQSHELVYRRVVAQGDPAVLVLRSLEILRGSLIDLRALDREPPAPPPPVPPTPPPAASPAPEPVHRTWLGLSGALLAPHAGRSLGAGALLALRYRIASRFALHAEVLAPLSGWSVEGEGGSAKIWLGSATVAALVNPWGERWLSPGLGLGLGALGLRTRGEAQPGFEASSELHAALFPHGRVELALGLTPSLRLRAALVAGFATPRPVLLFAEKREESWLNPLLISTLGVEVTLP
ncbi:MAG TPA: hypothetical protein VHB79_23410 [Polyangiaceae bacterium]|nr:hypothetical protein [Polyangiaceae bacterium]